RDSAGCVWGAPGKTPPLPQHGPQPAAQKKDADHEQHVIESVRHDVCEAKRQIAPRRLDAAYRSRPRRERLWRACLSALEPDGDRIVGPMILERQGVGSKRPRIAPGDLAG